MALKAFTFNYPQSTYSFQFIKSLHSYLAYPRLVCYFEKKSLLSNNFHYIV